MVKYKIFTVKRTTWGFWNPEELNHNPDHYSERSLNSLQIITYLAAAEVSFTC